MTWEPDYVTLAEVKNYLRITDTDDDTLISGYITTSSRAVDGFCHRQFGKVSVAEVREYDSVWDPHLRKYIVDIDDLMDVTGLAILDSGATVVSSYELWPLNAPQKGKPYERIRCSTSGRLQIEARWGWTSVPSAVKSATFLQAARLGSRRDSPFGVAGSPTDGSEVRLLASLDPDLKTSLGKKYRREWWSVSARTETRGGWCFPWT